MLERTSLIQRKAAGEETAVQLMAANVDILLIVSSCNADFNLTRLCTKVCVSVGGNQFVWLGGFGYLSDDWMGHDQ